MKKPPDNNQFQEFDDVINSVNLWIESSKPQKKLWTKVAEDMGKVIDSLDPPGSFSGVEQQTVKAARSKVGLSHEVQLVAGNSFSYKRRQLWGLTLNSKPGKLFKLLLTQPNNFVPDTLSLKVLDLADSRDLGFVLRDLKKALGNNSLKLAVGRRQTPAGYLLNNIQELHPQQE